MKSKDLKQLTDVELKSKIAETRGHVRDLRFKVITRQHTKIRDLRKARKDLARMLALLAIMSK